MPMPCVALPSEPPLFWMVPPDAAVPLPVMVKGPLPVVSSVTPLVAVPPLESMLRNVRPAAPMVVLVTLSDWPVVVASVLTIEVLFCVAVRVPLLVAVQAPRAAVASARAGVGGRTEPPRVLLWERARGPPLCGGRGGGQGGGTRGLSPTAR